MIRLTAGAVADLDNGVRTYDEASPGLGLAFLDAVDATFRRIAEHPVAGPIVPGLPRLRRRVVRRFPYSVIYEPTKTEVRIVAVAHQHRHPAYWQGRL